MMNKGFTLIELLVVVLIIGILSAVALPQYTKAVEKSRAVQAITLVKAVKDAAEVYRLANGVYPSNLSQIDIEVSTNLKDFVWDESEFSDGRFALKRRGADLGYFIIFSGTNRTSPSFSMDEIAGVLYCSSDTKKGIEICRAVGKKKLNASFGGFEFWGV